MSREIPGFSFEEIYGEKAIKKAEAKRKILEKTGVSYKPDLSIEGLSNTKNMDGVGALGTAIGLIVLDGLAGYPYTNLVSKIDNASLIAGLVCTAGFYTGGALTYNSIKESIKSYFKNKELERNVNSFLKSEHKI